MAKQLLGKEVAAALNEKKIIGQVAQLKEKEFLQSLASSELARDRMISLMRQVQLRDVIPLVLKLRRSFFREDVSKEELLEVIDKVNKDDSIHGVLMFPSASGSSESSSV